MSKILSLTTLHNQHGSADKVYLIATLKDSEGNYRLATAYGPRGGSRPLVVAQPILASQIEASTQHQELSREKRYRKNYQVCDWTSSNHMKLQAVIKDLDPAFYAAKVAPQSGTVPVSTAQPQPVATPRPVLRPQPKRDEPKPRPSTESTPLGGRSSRDEREIDL